jgi:hypothetical protein
MPRCIGVWSTDFMRIALLTDVYLAEIIVRTYKQRSHYAGLSLMVWILKREVRAFGGCLGMYRR